MRHSIHTPHFGHDAVHLAAVIAVLAAILGMTILSSYLAFDSGGSEALINTRPMILTPLPR